MGTRLSVAARTAELQGIINLAGAGAKGLWYDGAAPAALGTPAGTKLAELLFGAVLGTAALGVMTFAAFTQTPSSFVGGTPTFFRITDAAGTVLADIDVGSGITFLGLIATNVAISGSLTWQTGNVAT